MNKTNESVRNPTAPEGVIDWVKTKRELLSARLSAGRFYAQEALDMTMLSRIEAFLTATPSAPQGGGVEETPTKAGRFGGTETAWRMDAYYYNFTATGVAAIDLILSAVACAGKAYHHTDQWNEDCDPYHDRLRGNSPVMWIENAAHDAAKAMKDIAQPRTDAAQQRPAEAQAWAEYSIDADPAGIRARAADAITGALAFGAQGTNKPPDGHWLEPFWDMARAEAQGAGEVVEKPCRRCGHVVFAWANEEGACCLDCTAPPSAPVGVEGFEQWYARVDARFWSNWDACNVAFHAGKRAALAQQPAAVNEAMVERALAAYLRRQEDGESLYGCVTAALTAALAGQQQGGAK